MLSVLGCQLVKADERRVSPIALLDISAAFRSCVKVEVTVLGSPFLISLVVSVDVKQH